MSDQTRKVKIIGAGSIGNHLAQACRRHSWDVTIIDRDSEALRRTREELYPSRYGAWDEAIKLYTATDEPRGGFDVIFIGTPPDVRLGVATRLLAEEPKVLQLEKPLFPPITQGFEDFETFRQELARHPTVSVVTGYDHVLGEAVEKTIEVARTGGGIKTIEVCFREHWQGIFAAHPWLSGPTNSYLGYWQRGGGASGEHSHALNFWQHLARELGCGRVFEVSAEMQMVDEGGAQYDEVCLLNLRTESGFVGNVAQDVVTRPTLKRALVVTDEGTVEWVYNWQKDVDRVVVSWTGEEIKISRKRPDDFYREICRVDKILRGERVEQSPISLSRGLETMAVLRAAHLSHHSRNTVMVRYL